MERKDNHGYGDGQARQPNTGPTGGDTGQRTKMHDKRNRTAVSYEEADNFPTREEIEREQQERMR